MLKFFVAVALILVIGLTSAHVSWALGKHRSERFEGNESKFSREFKMCKIGTRE